ncbi:hypothetical protein [Sporosarcina beigongshangi]|nr:hypothetical protein [Sporosarcina beigongshangi]
MESEGHKALNMEKYIFVSGMKKYWSTIEINSVLRDFYFEKISPELNVEK